MSLLYDMYNYLKEDLKNMYLLGFTLFCNIFITLSCSEIMVYITNGSINMIPYYLSLITVPTIINYYIVNPLTLKMACNVQKKFIENSITLHKNNKMPIVFWENCKNSSISLFTIIDWGIPSIFHLFGIMLDIIWTFYKKDIIYYLYIILFISIMFYLFSIKELQQ